MVKSNITRLDLSSSRVIIVGDRAGEQDSLAKMLTGFGVTKIARKAGEEEAFHALSTEQYDLAIVDASIRVGDAYSLISSTRRLKQRALQRVPIILVCGDVRNIELCRARDCGANFLLAKPISASVLFNRIVWLSRTKRLFLESKSYVGPDRRIKDFDLPAPFKDRRAGDLIASVSETM